MFKLLKNTLYSVFGGIGCVLSAVIVLLVVFQEKLVYVPVIPNSSRDYDTDPEKWGFHYEDVWLETRDKIKLHSWLIFHPEEQSEKNIGHRMFSIRALMRRLKVNVFMLSYRGYGASEGSPSQHGIMMDAQAALDFLLTRNDINSSKIVVFGRSLGGAVGAHLLKDNPHKVKAIILENTFTSILDMAGKIMPFLKVCLSSKGFGALNFLVRSQWRTIDIIGKIKEPILFISGLKDDLVPPSHMRELYSKTLANPSCQLVEIAGGHHMDTWHVGGEVYWRYISQFLEKYV